MSLGGTFATFYVGSAAVRDWTSGALTGDDLRFAGGVVAIVYLLTRLALDAPNPAAVTLVKTRRDLAFGRIDAATAVKQAELALSGVKGSEFFKNEIDRYQSLLSSARNEVSEVHAKADGLRASSRPPASIKTIADSCNDHIERAEESIRAIKKLRIHRRSATAVLGEEAQETFDNLRSQTEGLESELARAGARVKSEILPLLLG